jgi:hypothetical protein
MTCAPGHCDGAQNGAARALWARGLGFAPGSGACQAHVSQHATVAARESEGEWSWNIRTGPACKAGESRGDHTRADPKDA